MMIARSRTKKGSCKAPHVETKMHASASSDGIVVLSVESATRERARMSRGVRFCGPEVERRKCAA